MKWLMQFLVILLVFCISACEQPTTSSGPGSPSPDEHPEPDEFWVVSVMKWDPWADDLIHDFYLELADEMTNHFDGIRTVSIEYVKMGRVYWADVSTNLPIRIVEDAVDRESYPIYRINDWAVGGPRYLTEEVLYLNSDVEVYNPRHFAFSQYPVDVEYLELVHDNAVYLETDWPRSYLTPAFYNQYPSWWKDNAVVTTEYSIDLDTRTSTILIRHEREPLSEVYSENLIGTWNFFVDEGTFMPILIQLKFYVENQLYSFDINPGCGWLIADGYTQSQDSIEVESKVTGVNYNMTDLIVTVNRLIDFFDPGFLEHDEYEGPLVRDVDLVVYQSTPLYGVAHGEIDFDFDFANPWEYCE